MSMYKIEKNIPIPSRLNTTPSNPLVTIIKKLKITESIIITDPFYIGPLNYNKLYYIAKKFNYKIVLRKINEKELRLWRIK